LIRVIDVLEDYALRHADHLQGQRSARPFKRHFACRHAAADAIRPQSGVHVSDSSGVLNLLAPGQKVDVQVLVARKVNNAEPELRTILEGIQVLAVNPQPEPSSQGVTLPAVTLLTNPADADTLALADSGARVRLALRNPLDNATRARTAVTLDAILRGGAAAKAQ